MGIVHTHLWFENQAEEAAQFWTSVVPKSRILGVRRAPAGVPGVEEGAAFVVEIELDGHRVTLLNAGPYFTLDESFSFVLECATQEEVDRYWEALQAGGGEPSECGWLKDRFGVSWQVVPAGVDDLTLEPSEAGQRAMACMLSQQKLDIHAIRAAYEGREVPTMSS